MREGIRKNPGKGPAPDLSCPLLCTWLEALAPGAGWGAAFDTRVRGPFGKGAPEIARLLEAAGYAPLAEPEGYVVKGRHGPLRAGELERARAWGEQLALASRRGPRPDARPEGWARRCGRSSLTRRFLPIAFTHGDLPHVMQASPSPGAAHREVVG